jgi:hypothetical protein
MDIEAFVHAFFAFLPDFCKHLSACGFRMLDALEKAPSWSLFSEQ